MTVLVTFESFIQLTQSLLLPIQNPKRALAYHKKTIPTLI
jgi:hypothetical protein